MKKRIIILIAAILIISAVISAFALLRRLDIEPTGKNYSDDKNIFISIIDFNKNGRSREITLRWNNNSDTTATYSPFYIIERYEDATWVSAQQDDAEIDYPDEVYAIQSNSMAIVDYPTDAFLLEAGELYRIRTWCTTSNGKTIRVWAEFTVK